MYVRQCIECGVIDPRETFEDEQAAADAAGWTCGHCGARAFESVVMSALYPMVPTADLYE